MSRARPTIRLFMSLPITVIATKIVAIPSRIRATPPNVSPNVDSWPFSAPITGLVIGLMKSKPFRLMSPVANNGETSQWEIFSRMPNIISSGRKMNTASKLKKSWIVALAKARLNSSLQRMWPRLTRVLVTVVPMLAPITIGIAVSTGRPPATKPTIIEVTVLDDWISAVATKPIIKPATGCEANSNRTFAWSPVAHLNPLPTIATASSSKYSMKAKFAQRSQRVVAEIGAAVVVAWFIIVFSIDLFITSSVCCWICAR